MKLRLIKAIVRWLINRDWFWDALLAVLRDCGRHIHKNPERKEAAG